MLGLDHDSNAGSALMGSTLDASTRITLTAFDYVAAQPEASEFPFSFIAYYLHNQSSLLINDRGNSISRLTF